MPVRDAPVIVSREGSLGRLHLNRPKAINSLTLQMVRLLDEGLTEFETDDCIASVLITGEGERLPRQHGRSDHRGTRSA